MTKQRKLDANGKPKFGMMDKLAYAAGDFGCNMSFALKSTVQTFWLVYMMMDTGLLSALLVVVQIWDAINDPLIGSIIDNDRRKYRLGKFKSYILFGACGLLFAGALMFIPVPNADTWIKAMLYIAGYVIWDAFYTIANVPYGSLLSLVSEDIGERAQLSAWRSVGSGIGNVVPIILLPALVWRKVQYDGTTSFLDRIEIPKGFSKEDFLINPKTGEAYNIGDYILNPSTGNKVELLLGDRLIWVALIMGVLGFICFMFMLKYITIRVDENSVKTNETQKFNVITAFTNFIKNRPAVGATVAAMGMFLGMQSATTASTIMFAVRYDLASLSGVMQAIGFAPMFLFVPFIKKLVEKYGKKEMAVVGTFVSVVGSLVMLFFPMITNNTVSIVVFMIGLVIFGTGMGVYTCVSWAMIGDAIDYNEWKFGTRDEGTVYSLHSFFRKLAQGLGPAMALLIMGWLGYDEKLGTIGQSAETALNMCWLVAGLFIVSAVLQFIGITFIYNLDKKELGRMTAALGRNVEADDIIVVTTAEDNDNLVG
ncbi:MAG: MFS transporter [Clostridia bacterium]|nr:MFS transporter [Clostridia bacterium]